MHVFRRNSIIVRSEKKKNVFFTTRSRNFNVRCFLSVENTTEFLTCILIAFLKKNYNISLERYNILTRMPRNNYPTHVSYESIFSILFF